MALSSFAQRILDRSGILTERPAVLPTKKPLEIKAPSMELEMPKTEELLVEPARLREGLEKVGKDIGRFLSAMPSDEELTQRFQEKVGKGIEDEEARKELIGEIGKERSRWGVIGIPRLEMEAEPKLGLGAAIQVEEGKIKYDSSKDPVVDVFGVVGALRDVTVRLGRSALAKIARSTKIDEIFGIIKKETKGVSDDLARKLSKQFTEITDPRIIQREFSTQVTREMTERGARVAIDESLEPLAQEAKRGQPSDILGTRTSRTAAQKEAEAFVKQMPGGGFFEGGGISAAEREAAQSRAMERIRALQSKGTQVISKELEPLAKVTAEAIPEILPKERRFITRAREVIPEAKKIAGQYIPRSTDELSIKASNLIKENLAAAERLVREATDEKAVATASELLKHYARQAEKTADEAIKNAIYDQAAEIANTIAAKLTEQGRAIQAASILARLTPEGQIRFAAKEIQRYNLKHPTKQIAELTGEQAKKIGQEMKEISTMPPGVEQAMRFQKLQREISALVPSEWWRKWVAIWKAGLLTGIKTSGLNIFANISHAASEIFKDIPAAGVDILLSLITGKRTKTFSIKDFGKGVIEGAQKGWRYLRTGFDERDIAAKLDYKRVNFKNKAVQTYVDGVFRILGTEDQPFYYGTLRRSLNDQAAAEAANKGLKGKEAKAFIDNLVENPTDQMSIYAAADAETAVFQNKTAIGAVARKLQKIPGGEFVVPFGRTPSAVAMQVINYTPVGVFIEIGKQIARKQFDQRMLSQAIGRGLTGTGVLWLGTKLYENDVMTLAYPKTERERELWKAEGRKANAIKIGNEWRTVQTLGPIGPVLLIGGYFKKSFKETGSATSAITEATFGTLDSFTEQTFLKGVDNVLGAITDPERGGEYAVSSFISSHIPTIINDVARSTDPKERRAENVLQRIQSRIPILRQKLEPQVTVLGEERARIGNPLEVMIDPTRPSPDVSTSVVQELRRLMDIGYKVSPTLLGDKKGYEGLTQKENTELWELAGGIVNDKLTSLFSKETYIRLPDEEKAKYVESTVKQAKIDGRTGMVLKLTEGLRGEELKKKLSELKASKLMTREVFKKYMELR